MLILAIGDIIGRPGRRAVQQLLPSLRQQYGLELVIANGENAAGGFGLTPDTAKELLDAGVDVNTEDEDGLTALMWAIRGGTWGRRVEIVQLLLDAGANVNAKSDNGITVLMTVAFSGTFAARYAM